jgi:hypothetical protein
VRADSVPLEILRLVEQERVDFSQKVQWAIARGEVDVEDVRSAIVTGRLYKRARDEVGAAADGFKYVILGRACSGRPFYVCGKLVRDTEGRWFFVITAHEAE